MGRKVQRKHIQQAFKCVDECVLAADTDVFTLSLSVPCLSGLIRRFALFNLCDVI